MTLRSASLTVVTGLAAALAGLGGPGVSAARGSFYRLTIANDTGADVNDLSLVFSQGGLDDVRLQAPGGSPLGRLDRATNTAVFPPNSFGTVPDQGMVQIDVHTALLALQRPILSDLSRWTLNGTPQGPITAVGEAIDVSVSGGTRGIPPLGVVTFWNTGATPLIYSDVVIYANNDGPGLSGPGGFNAKLIPDIPTTFTVDPGSFVQFRFGDFNTRQYVFASANAATAARPDRLFRLATSAVPEPAAAVSLGLGGFGLLAGARRRRRGAAAGAGDGHGV
jgi:hypothetical protein